MAMANINIHTNCLPSEVKADIPNLETVAALNEYYEMKNYPEKYPHHSSFKTAMDEVITDA